MLGRMLTRLIDAQGRWADPLGGTLDGLISPILARLPALKDALNGTWLGHPLHATFTDVPIGSLTLMVVLDVLGQDVAADIALGIGILAMLAAAIAGSADFVDTHGRDRMASTVHATVMVIAVLLLLVALILRLVGEDERALGVPLAFAGYLVLIAGAYVGGEIVFTLGYPVDRHAWREPEASWQRLDVDDIPEGRPMRAEVGPEPIVIVRHGETIDALHATCAHAGGPLAEGSLEDGCIVCPWHGSRFDLASGQRRRGPSVHDQPRFEIREHPDGGYEARAVVRERS